MTDLTFNEGQSKLGVGEKTIVPTERERAVFKALLNDPLFNVSDTRFPSWMVDTVGRLGLGIPVGQIVGFSQYTANGDRVQTSPFETTASASFTDLSTAGPSLSGLPDGNYVVFFGAQASSDTAGESAVMGIKVNAVEATDDERVIKQGTDAATVVTAVLKTLNSAGNNTITCRYKSSSAAASAQFNSRWLIAIRYSNL